MTLTIIFLFVAVDRVEDLYYQYGGISTTPGNRIKRLENAAARAITGNYDFINVRGDTLFNDLGFTRFNDR